MKPSEMFEGENSELRKTFDSCVEQPQQLPVTFVFKVRHSPDRASHLHFVLKKYLQEKGIVLNDNNTVDV